MWRGLRELESWRWLKLTPSVIVYRALKFQSMQTIKIGVKKCDKRAGVVGLAHWDSPLTFTAGVVSSSLFPS